MSRSLYNLNSRILIRICHALATLPERAKDIHPNRGKDHRRGHIGKRFTLQTAPAYDNKNHPQYRVPTTKVGGTVTRRSDGVPLRRPTDTNNPLNKLPSTAPAIAAGNQSQRAVQAWGSQWPQLVLMLRFIVTPCAL